MAIFCWPSMILQSKAEDVVDFSGKNGIISSIISDMHKLMKEHNGIGLAANQIGQLINIFVMDCQGISGTFINARLIDLSEETFKYTEGCLSFPGVSVKTNRSKSVIVEYCTISGEIKTEEFNGLPAVCVQHEISHLHGQTIVDLLSPLRKKLVLERYAKQLEQIRRAHVAQRSNQKNQFVKLGQSQNSSK